MNIRGRGKWLNRLTSEDKTKICFAYRQFQSITQTVRFIQGPSHSVVVKILREAGVELGKPGWPSPERMKEISELRNNARSST